MSITIRDIAREANVSHTTVSLVLNKRAGRSIPAPTRQRVIDVATTLGYRPNQLARALASGRSHVIEVRGIRLGDPYYVHFLSALQSILADDGYRVIITPYQPDSGQASAAVNWPVDGLIVIDEPEIGARTAVRGRTTPIVAVGAVCASEPIDTVTVDLAAGASAAMEHLRMTGRRRIAYLADIPGDEYNADRERAYSQAQANHGCEAEWILCGVGTRPAARDAVLSHVSEHGVPDAILCRSDSLAIGALRALNDLGIRVPEQTAIVGCNGIEEVEFQTPKISSIEIPVAEMCRSAWAMLNGRIENPHLPRQCVTHSSRLVVRDSSRQPSENIISQS